MLDTCMIAIIGAFQLSCSLSFVNYLEMIAGVNVGTFKLTWKPWDKKIAQDLNISKENTIPHVFVLST